MTLDKIQHILIIGLGISGFDAARLARSKNFQVTILDGNSNETLLQRQNSLESLGAKVELHSSFSSTQQAELIIVSPGIPPNSPAGQLIKNSKLPLLSEIDFASHYSTIPLIGITGTNGKTTTCELLTHCLNRQGIKSIAAGNIGRTFSSILLEEENLQAIVLELSSFQLEQCPDLELHAAAFLNFSSDHAERYDNEQAYFDAKANIFGQCPNQQNHVVHQTLTKHFPSYKGQLIDTEQLNKLEHFPLKGQHNLENLSAVILLAQSLNCSPEQTIKAAESFQIAPHRCEPFLINHGHFINDSKATNPDATNRAIESAVEDFSGKIILIAGGRDKEMDFTLMKGMIIDNVKELVLYGEARQTIATVFKGLLPIHSVEIFSSAVEHAFECRTEHDLLLLSPACASQDQFKSYGERGNAFKEQVKELCQGNGRAVRP